MICACDWPLYRDTLVTRRLGEKGRAVLLPDDGILGGILISLKNHTSLSDN